MPRCVHRGSESLAAKYRFGMCPNFRESASRWMDQYSNHWNAQEQCLRGCRCLAHSVCGWCFHPPLHSERMDGGWKLSIQFLHSIGRQIWQRCKSVPLQNSFAVVDSDFTLQTRPFCLHFSEQFLFWPIPTSRYKYDLRLETREFGVRTLGKPEQWSCDYPTRIDEPTTPTLPKINFSYQEALNWRKWTKGGCSFLLLSAQHGFKFDRPASVTDDGCSVVRSAYRSLRRARDWT